MKFCKACGAETTKMYCNERCRSAYRRSKNKPELLINEPCYFDDCEAPSKDSVTFQPPGLKKYHMHLRVATCEVHAHLLKEVA